MFEKEFVPYEESLELKELGFNKPCFGRFASDGRIMLEPTYKTGFTLAPTYSQAFRWFREEYNINTIVYSNASGYLFQWQDAVGGTHRGWSEYEGPNYSGVLDTYEDAELACLKKLIEIVKQKQ